MGSAVSAPDFHHDEIHTGVMCDGCMQQPIRGGRHKCTECDNFDLCDTCFESTVRHQFHPLQHHWHRISSAPPSNGVRTTHYQIVDGEGSMQVGAIPQVQLQLMLYELEVLMRHFHQLNSIRNALEISQMERNHLKMPASREAVDALAVFDCESSHVNDYSSCPICLDDFDVGDSVIELPCSHIFHPKCLECWFESHCSCPVCRFNLPSDPPPELANTRSNLTEDEGPGAERERENREMIQQLSIGHLASTSSAVSLHPQFGVTTGNQFGVAPGRDMQLHLSIGSPAFFSSARVGRDQPSLTMPPGHSSSLPPTASNPSNGVLARMPVADPTLEINESNRRMNLLQRFRGLISRSGSNGDSPSRRSI